MLAKVNAVELMAEVILELTLELVARDLLEAVSEAKDRAFRFEALLSDLECTVTRLLPKISEIERLSQELGESPKDEIQNLKLALVEAKQLVSKCSEVACWDCCRRDRYSKKLLRLHAALRWLIETELPVGQSEDLMRILVEVKLIRQTNNIAACFLFPILLKNLGRSSDPIGLGDDPRHVESDGIPRSGSKVLPVVSGFKRIVPPIPTWFVSLLSLFRSFPNKWFHRYKILKDNE